MRDFKRKVLLDSLLFLVYDNLYSNYNVKGIFMNNLFSIGEMAKQQNISRQTLIFYDKIGLFSPAYVDPENGYRYYSASQLDSLDTICIMKKIGFSLEEIRAYMKSYSMDQSIVTLRNQLTVLDGQIAQLQMIRSRVEHRCQALEQVLSIRDEAEQVTVEPATKQWIFLQEVEKPYTLEKISLATKQCFVRAFQEQLPVYFQSGAVIPFERIQNGKYVEASHVFLPIEQTSKIPEIRELPEGSVVCTYHKGDYGSVGRSYERILEYCQKNHLEIVSDSYEFAINDYLSTDNENEYITKIQFYVKNKNF